MLQLTESCVVDDDHIIAVRKYSQFEGEQFGVIVTLSGGTELTFYGDKAKEAITNLKDFSRFWKSIAEW